MLRNVTVRIVLADDDRHVLDALRALLDGTADFSVVATASTAEAAVLACRTHAPDLAVLDIGMPGGGLTAARRLRDELPGIRVVVFTAHDDPELRREAHAVGVTDYLLKSGDEDVVEALREATA